jgi:hypothetical protein
MLITLTEDTAPEGNEEADERRGNDDDDDNDNDNDRRNDDEDEE